MLAQFYTKDGTGIVVGKARGSDASNHDLVGRWVRGINFDNKMVIGLVTGIRNTEDGVVVDVLANEPISREPLIFGTSLMVATVEQVCHQCYSSEFTTMSSGSFSFYAGDVSDNITDKIVCALCGEEIVLAASTYLEEELDEIIPF